MQFKERKTVKIHLLVNGVYNNEKTINLIGKTKKDMFDKEFLRTSTTIFKTKKDGTESFAFKQFKTIPEDKLKFIKKIVALTNETEPYNGNLQYVITKIEDITFFTQEEFDKKEMYRKEYLEKKQQEQSTVSNQAPVVKQEPQDVPWNLDI